MSTPREHFMHPGHWLVSMLPPSLPNRRIGGWTDRRIENPDRASDDRSANRLSGYPSIRLFPHSSPGILPLERLLEIIHRNEIFHLIAVLPDQEPDLYQDEHDAAEVFGRIDAPMGEN